MTIFYYFMLFSSFFSSSILFFLPGIIEYKEMVLISSGLFYVLMLLNLFKSNFIIRKKMLNTIILAVIVLILYSITPLYYGENNEKWISYFLVLIGQIIPSVILGGFIGNQINIQKKMMRLAPILAIIFSFISFNAIMHPTSVTTGGFVNNLNGLDYNSASYMSACAAGFGQYFIIMHDEIKWFVIFRSNLIKNTFFFLSVLNFFSILIGGGRGGLVTFICISICSLIVAIKKKKLTISTVIKYFIVIVLILIIGFLVINGAMKSDISTSGFERILNTIETGDSSGRDSIWTTALTSFIDSPLFGHGLGSVFYELGEYSHNILIDCLLEQGILGILILIYMLSSTIKGLLKMYRDDRANYLWSLMFIYSLIQSFFSGYYLAQIPIYFTISLCYSRYGK